jgi:hypothetical protein
MRSPSESLYDIFSVHYYTDTRRQPTPSAGIPELDVIVLASRHEQAIVVENTCPPISPRHRATLAHVG